MGAIDTSSKTAFGSSVWAILPATVHDALGDESAIAVERDGMFDRATFSYRDHTHVLTSYRPTKRLFAMSVPNIRHGDAASNELGAAIRADMVDRLGDPGALDAGADM